MSVTNSVKSVEAREDDSLVQCSLLRTSDIINKILESQLNFSESSGRQESNKSFITCSPAVISEVQSCNSERIIGVESDKHFDDMPNETCIKKNVSKHIVVGCEERESDTVKPHTNKVVRLTQKKRKKFTLGSHIEIINGSPPQFRCKICNYTFRQKQQCSYHAFCPTGKKPYKCDICGQGFVKKPHLDYHIRTHTGETPFHCSFCGKGFKQKAKVKRHEHIHTGDGKSVCDICKKVVSSSYSLKRHYKMAHSTEKPSVCECGKSFAIKAHFERHKLSHSRTREFVCDACGKAFIRRYSLIDHLKRHSGRLFSCEKCPRKFKIKTDLIRHKYAHIEEPTFECKVCNMKFRRKDNMDRHLKNTHPEALSEEPQNAAADLRSKKSEVENSENRKTGNAEEKAVLAILEAMLEKSKKTNVKSHSDGDGFQTHSVITHTKFILDQTKKVETPEETARESVIKFHKM